MSHNFSTKAYRREYFIELTKYDLQFAMTLATEKYNFSRNAGHVDRMKGSEEHLILTDARAIMAERAVSRVMGWKWERNINGAGQPDFIINGMKVDVKSTIRDDPMLRIPCYSPDHGMTKNKMDRFVLVSVNKDHKYLVVRGWISKSEAIRYGRIGYRASGCYWEVGLKHLKFMEDW